jgi:hypothetical protein
MTAKPRLKLVGGEFVPHDETPLQRARRRYGREFCTETWNIGEGARFWTTERRAQLSVANEIHRKERK